MEKQKHILLCVAGGTPQIITETLWALTQPPRRERVDEIRVITTLEGRKKVRQLLLESAQRAESTETLLGIEGSASAAHFKLFGALTAVCVILAYKALKLAVARDKTRLPFVN
jgi:CRISPR-associated protein (TIGR02584 family)